MRPSGDSGRMFVIRSAFSCQARLFGATPFLALKTSEGLSMPRFTHCLLLAALMAVLSGSASALPVEITYSIEPGAGFNQTGMLGGLLPTGGTAKVIWSMTSLNGDFINGGAGQVVSIKLTHSTQGTFSFPTFGALQFAFATDVTTPIVTRARFARFRMSGAPGALPPTQSIHTNTLYAVAHRSPPVTAYTSVPPGQFFSKTFAALITRGPGTQTTYGYPNALGVNGQEVAREVVPEPSAGALFALGLVGLSGACAWWRRRVSA